MYPLLHRLLTVVSRERNSAMVSMHVKTLSLGLLLAVGGLLGAGAPPPPVWGQSRPCNLTTLHGTYTFVGQGFQLQHNQQQPITFAGQETYDGAGEVQGQWTQSINGEISRVTYSGSYTVTPACVATETTTDSTGVTTHFDLFVSPNGNEFTFVATDPGVVLSGSERRVSRER
jgi:hypothetical protein